MACSTLTRSVRSVCTCLELRGLRGQLLLLPLAHGHRDREALDLLAGVGLLLLERRRGPLLPLRLGLLVLQFPLELGELAPRQGVLLGLGLVLEVQVGLRLLRVDQLGRQLLAVRLQLPEAALAGSQRRVGGIELLLQRLTGELLLGERLPHRLHEVLVLGNRVGGDLVDGGLARARRLRPLPPRQRDEVQEQEVDDEEEERPVHRVFGRKPSPLGVGGIPVDFVLGFWVFEPETLFP